MEDEQQPILTHQPCPDCGSTDARAFYSTHDFCYSCNERFPPTMGEGEHTPQTPTEKNIQRTEFKAIPSRRITEESARKWSYGSTEWFGQQTQCANYLNVDRKVVAQKMRTRNKEFPWLNRKAFKGLYGQWLWRDGGKKVVITEGELDAISVSQVQNHKWPVVSLPDGGGKKAVKAVLEAYAWLQKFEQIILFFDNDEAGRETVELVKKALPMGKVFITYAPEGYKDASDMLVAGKSKDIINCIWEAKAYRPDGLLSGSDIIARLTDRPQVLSFSYPEYMEALNYLTGGGVRLSELDTWTSGTGMGKTTIIKALQNHFFHTTEFNQALIHLEEPLEDTGDDLIAYEVGKRFTINDPEYRDSKEYAKVANDLFMAEDAMGKKRFQLFDAFGSVEDESLFDIIRYAAQAEGCMIVWVDHLSILVSDLDGNEDERRKIDRIMHGLKELTIELGIYIGLISHLRKPNGNGKSFEEGAVPTLDDLRGSGSIKQLSNTVLAISRDQQHENSTARNTSAITVLKCRKTGRTGAADFLMFEDATGRLVKGTDPSDAAPDGFSEADETGDY